MCMLRLLIQYHAMETVNFIALNTQQPCELGGIGTCLCTQLLYFKHKKKLKIVQFGNMPEIVNFIRFLYQLPTDMTI